VAFSTSSSKEEDGYTKTCGPRKRGAEMMNSLEEAMVIIEQYEESQKRNTTGHRQSQSFSYDSKFKINWTTEDHVDLDKSFNIKNDCYA
jgi:hypothetical protein